MNNKDTTITNEDMNLIDSMNGSSSIDKRGNSAIVNDKGETLKGALSEYNGLFSKYEELMFIRTIQNQLYEYQTERFNYENLPLGLTKYRIEDKILQHGSVFIIKIGEEFYALNYRVVKSNIYNEPKVIKIVEPKSTLNNKEFDITFTNGVIIRNNVKMESIFQKAYRYISAMERILFQIEKNITSSAPKGIIFTGNNELTSGGESNDSGLKNSFESVINSQDTFFELKGKGDDDFELMNGENPIFTPIELTDRSVSLIQQFSFMKEQLKEIVGAIPNTLQNKKERVITSEIDNQDSFATSSRQHAFNVRVIDIAKANDMFGTDIVIEYQSDTRSIEEEKNNITSEEREKK